MTWISIAAILPLTAWRNLPENMKVTTCLEDNVNS